MPGFSNVFRLNPIISAAATRIFGDLTSIEEIQPEEREHLPPPAILPGQIERITKAPPGAPLEYHLKVVSGAPAVHAPVLRKRVRNAVVSLSGFSSLGYTYGSRRDIFRDVRIGRPLEVETLRYCDSSVSRRFFGHWLRDAVPASRIDSMGSLWMPHSAGWNHADDYCALLGITTINSPVLFANELVFYQDHGQGSLKRQRYGEIRQALNALPPDAGAPRKIFLSRASGGVSRTIQEEHRLIEYLSSNGWTVLDVTVASVAEIVSTLSNADVVVSIEGSHVAHAQVSLRPGSLLIVMCPHDRFTSIQLDHANANRVSFGFVILNGSAGTGYIVDWNEVERTIEMAERRSHILLSFGL